MFVRALATAEARGTQRALALKDWVLALAPEERYAAIRRLAETDHAALAAIPVTREQVDRLYPYFARSAQRR